MTELLLPNQSIHGSWVEDLFEQQLLDWLHQPGQEDINLLDGESRYYSHPVLYHRWTYLSSYTAALCSLIWDHEDIYIAAALFRKSTSHIQMTGWDRWSTNSNKDCNHLFALFTGVFLLVWKNSCHISTFLTPEVLIGQSWPMGDRLKLLCLSATLASWPFWTKAHILSLDNQKQRKLLPIVCFGKISQVVTMGSWSQLKNTLLGGSFAASVYFKDFFFWKWEQNILQWGYKGVKHLDLNIKNILCLTMVN